MITVAPGMRLPQRLAAQSYPGQQYQEGGQAVEQKSGSGYLL
ncbi:hypothetical protein J2Z21_001951 [Streptomyces griseochromogenes]|uniref:Uncharacterized protein n=1 Tax=Streptomyces griseochromogenes TaxID=68214 RepID=A0ABS4LNP8_9ACTN|nr:hypothetical protein [Streptomyces griseochromogenes]MBP2049026.1 hypothetical protein [Streptomyces griseochromogenes]